MIEGTIFIGAIIIAVTEALKSLFPQVQGHLTVVLAGLLGLLVALVDTHIGVADMTIAQGIMTGLAAAGTVTVAQKV